MLHLSTHGVARSKTAKAGTARAAVFILASALFAAPGMAQSGMRGPLSGVPGGPSIGTPNGPRAKAKRLGPQYRAEDQRPVAAIEVQGNKLIPESKIRSYLTTRIERLLDPETVQADVRALMSTRLFRDVRTFQQDTPDGVIITFQVYERPVMQHIKYEGNEKLSDKKLDKIAGLKVGDPINPYSVEEARRKLEENYLEKGFASAKVRVAEGNQPGDEGVRFIIEEGKLQRIFKTRIEGNRFMSDAVLKARTGIETKPGILWMINGKLNRDNLKRDVERLEAFYRRFGYFQAKIEGSVSESKSGEWVTVTFQVDEGPRFEVADVLINGNSVFDQEELLPLLKLTDGETFSLDSMQRDLAAMRDFYGSKGYVFADIKAEPRFHETPGKLDIAYEISEGEPRYIERIVVNIRGDHPHTMRSVIINHAGLSPLELIDIRKIRAGERRIKASGLFVNEPARGVTPEIRIVPSERELGLPMELARPGERPDDPLPR